MFTTKPNEERSIPTQEIVSKMSYTCNYVMKWYTDIGRPSLFIDTTVDCMGAVRGQSYSGPATASPQSTGNQ